jgi:hypothetical protein
MTRAACGGARAFGGGCAECGGAEHESRIARLETMALRALRRRRGGSACGLGDVDLALTIPGTSISLAPSGGLGFAPYVRHHRTDTTFAQFVKPVTTARGAMWTLGLALRWRRLVLEQHVIVLFGAEEAVSVNKEYYPITLGWRF